MNAALPLSRLATPAATAGAAPGAGADAARKAELKQAAEAFEAIFMRQMIGSMRAATPGKGLFDSDASNQFRDLADARLADDMARTGSFGIAELLLKQFGAAE